MKKVIEITVCKHWCPFYGTTMDGMVCNHPYFEGKPTYEDMIINFKDFAVLADMWLDEQLFPSEP